MPPRIQRTPEMEAELRLHAKAGLTMQEAANRMGITRNMVAGMSYRMEPQLQFGNSEFSAAKLRRRRRPRRRRPPTRMIEMIEEPLIEPPPGELTLIELTEETCRWPQGEYAPFVFCGAKRKTESTYCPWHCRIAYQPSRPRPIKLNPRV